MDESQENSLLYKEVEIPADFYNTLTNHYFTQCTICNTHFDEDSMYLIEKACKRVNSGFVHTIFEYSICMDCAVGFNEKMSKKSLEAMQHFMLLNSNITKQREKLAEEEADYSNWLSHCIVNCSSIESLTEYNICGMFRGDKMMLGDFPYMMSLEAMEQMVEILSKETKEELDNFKRTHIDGPPEFEELFKRRPILVG